MCRTDLDTPGVPVQDRGPLLRRTHIWSDLFQARIGTHASGLVWCLVPVFGAALACMGGQTGDGTGLDRPGDLANDGACRFVTRPVEFESSTEMGFSAAELLAALPEVYTESLRWMSSDLWEASPEAGVGQLELRLRYSGEPILLREPVQDETGGPTSTEQMPLIEQAPQETLADDDDTTSEGDLAAADCRSLQINVQLEVRSAGGALNEVLEVPLLATSAAGGRFSATITVEQLQGALDVVWPMPREPMQWSGLQLSGELTPTGTQGTLVATFTGDMVSTGLIIAEWP